MTMPKKEQEAPAEKLSQYLDFTGLTVLEVGGNQDAVAANSFIAGGASFVTITGLEHITDECARITDNILIQTLSALELSAHLEPLSFDIVYGINVLEHIPSPLFYLEEIWRVIKPGGYVYLNGGPIWSSAIGHHLWIDYRFAHRASGMYSFFAGNPLNAPTPLPDWSHLLWEIPFMIEYLCSIGIPLQDAELISSEVYTGSSINRVFLHELEEVFKNCSFDLVESNSDVDSSSLIWGGVSKKPYIPIYIQNKLNDRYGVANYTSGFAEFILRKPTC